MKFKVVIAVFTLALIAGAAPPNLSLRPAVASAASGRQVQATFTKWLIGDTIPADIGPDVMDMVGLVGGDVGPGFFFGEILSLSDDHTTTSIHAVYHLNGSRARIVADLTIQQSDATGIASITGTVTGRRLHGATVEGGYQTMSSCPLPTPGNVLGHVCFQGTLTITR